MMIDKYYENQVKLLIRCLPAILKEECFAIKGGTAIISCKSILV